MKKGKSMRVLWLSLILGQVVLATPLFSENLNDDEDFSELDALESNAVKNPIVEKNTIPTETLKNPIAEKNGTPAESAKNGWILQDKGALAQAPKTPTDNKTATKPSVVTPKISPVTAKTDVKTDAKNNSDKTADKNSASKPVMNKAATDKTADKTAIDKPTLDKTASDKKDDKSNADKLDPNAPKGAAAIPPGQDLVTMDFPEMTDIQDIIKAVAVWTGKNVILDRNVTGKIQILSPRKVTKEEAYQAFLSALNVLELTTVETGKVIKIMKTRNAVRDNVQTYMGANWAPRTDEIITQIIPLKYIDSKQITQTLSRIVTPNAMITYEPTNTLIVSDSGYKVRRILDIVALLDVQTDQPKVVMVPIRYSDAKSIADKVNQILQAAGQSSGKASMRNFKVLVDDRTNSVIIFGPPRTISDVRELVKKFDVSLDDPSSQATIHVRPLDYADAKKLATTLSALATGNKAATRRPPIPGANPSDPSIADLGDNTKITADESTNSLLITGNKTNYGALNSIIRKLDMRRAQVFIEADILDLNTSGDFKAGTSIFAGQANKDGSGTKNIIGWQGKDGMGPLITAIASGQGTNGAVNTTAIQGVADAFGQNLAVGILSGQAINVPGIGNVTPGAIINLMKTDSSTRNLSTPNILTSNNEEATITVGDKVLFKSSVATATGTVSQQINKEDIDTTLTIKPNLSNSSNYVTLDFKIEANRQTGTVDGVPQIGKRNTKQKVTVKNGQTVVISGLMKDEQQEVYQKIPLLGDIPILGWLFRNSSISNRKSNLVIFLTPHIIYGAEDLARIYKAKLRERDEYFEQLFGKKYSDSDFYRKLPKAEDGEYRPNHEDKIEDERQEKTMKELKKMMDYGTEEQRAEEAERAERNKGKVKEEELLTVPVPIGGESGVSGVVPPPPAESAPAPENTEEQPVPIQ